MSEDGIPLHKMIQSLREQLKLSMDMAEKEHLKFALSPIDIELKIVATESSGVNGSIGWGILKFGAKSDVKDQVVHTLRLQLKPVLPDGGDPLLSAEVDC
jgi:hypothetical protein